MLKIFQFIFPQRKKIKMSAAYEHPEVYEKLTDNVFDTIVRKENQTEEMQKAQELINNVYKRKLYKLVDDTSAWPVKVVIITNY